MEKYSLPVQIEEIGKIEDSRFTRVKIYIAHTGENRNRSIFSKEVLTSMIPSLANVPILGYIDVTEEGIVDFHGHEERLEINNNQLEINYIGRAYGVIPTENNARFEYRYGSDGVEREYLVAEGILWNKFKEVEKIFTRDEGSKPQSMELHPESIKGYVNDEGLYVFTQAKFEGLCILGEHVTPAMISSTVERFSVADKLKIEMSELLNEFNAHFSTSNEKKKGDETMEDKKVLEEEVKVEEKDEKVESFEASEEKPEKDEQPEAEEKPEKEFEKSEKVEEEEKEDKEDPSESKDEKFEEDKKEEEPEKEEPETPEAPEEKEEDDKEEDKDEESKFDAEAMKATYASLLLEYEALKTEVESLREFKAGIELAEKKEKLSAYSTVLNKEEYKAIEDNLANFSLVDIEKEIGFILLKKNHFSAKAEEEQPQRVKASNMKEENPYGSLSSYFSK